MQHYWNKIQAELFFREFCENFKNTYFVEHLQTTDSEEY